MGDVIRFECRGCGNNLRTSSDKAGRQGKCPTCGTAFVVPYTELSLDDDFGPPPLTPPTKGETKFCHHCGAQIAKLAELCPKCGVRQPVIPGLSYDPNVAPNGKNRTTAALFALFLGGLGIHKFYLGEPWWGVLYLVFCWTFIPAIIALIDGIILLRGRPSSTSKFTLIIVSGGFRSFGG
jgi:TM2 domain-containing membrane protein YozV/DNA-directed RNA polymerase subunit RPC12/RpoP